MAAPSEHTLTTPVEATEDLLYDAVAIAFVYAAWAVASMWFGDRAGLVALVAATTVLTVVAVAGRGRLIHVSGDRPFIVDFATILLYCATTLALAALVIG